MHFPREGPNFGRILGGRSKDPKKENKGFKRKSQTLKRPPKHFYGIRDEHPPLHLRPPPVTAPCGENQFKAKALMHPTDKGVS